MGTIASFGAFGTIVFFCRRAPGEEAAEGEGAEGGGGVDASGSDAGNIVQDSFGRMYGSFGGIQDSFEVVDNAGSDAESRGATSQKSEP